MSFFPVTGQGSDGDFLINILQVVFFGWICYNNHHSLLNFSDLKHCTSERNVWLI